ncbi:MAG: dipeptidase [Nitrososphaerota archaeon]
MPPLVDLHEDISLYYVTQGAGLRFGVADFGIDLEGRHCDIPKYERSNTRLVFAAIAPLTPTISPKRVERLTSLYGAPFGGYRVRAPLSAALEHITVYRNLFRMHGDRLFPVRTLWDLERVERGQGIGLLLALEGAEPLEDVEDLELLYDLGLRSLQLTWNFDNRYGASCMSRKDYGLTGDGEELIALCNRLGVIVDLAHASKRTTLEVIEASRLPVIVSHANFRAVRDHPRNVDDEQLEALNRNRGVVGVTFIPPTISDHPSVEALADHIVYACERFGPQLVAIGTDYFGLLNMVEPRGLEEVSRIGNLWRELERRGLGEREIRMIAYENAMRVIRENAARWRLSSLAST